MKCLMQHYGVTHLIPLEERPRLVLAAEQELGIQAGLQDRVAQVRVNQLNDMWLFASCKKVMERGL
jgi:hypothetical protein